MLSCDSSQPWLISTLDHFSLLTKKFLENYMKNLRQFCATLILTLALTLSALAGEIGFPGTTNPPPPPEQQASITEGTDPSGATSAGDITTSGIAALDPVTGAALSLIRSLLSLF